MDIEQLIEPMRKGMTVTVGHDQVTGEATEPVVGMGHDPNSPFANDIPTDFINPEALDDRNQDPDDTIADALVDLYGDHMEGILAYMEATLPPQQVESYDAAVDSGDWSTVMPLLEQVADEYFQAIEQGMKFEAPEVTDEQVQEELDTLTQAEPEGIEFAYTLLGHAEAAEPGPERDLLMAAADFHAGKGDTETLANGLIEKYGLETLIPLYQKWNQ